MMRILCLVLRMLVVGNVEWFDKGRDGLLPIEIES